MSDVIIRSGEEVKLTDADLYPVPKSIKPTDKKTGTFYIWGDDIVNDMVRITSKVTNVGKAGCITGWVKREELNKIVEEPDVGNKVILLAGQRITVKDIYFYSSSTTDNPTCIMTGTYYIWSSEVVNGRIRITNYQTKAGMNGYILAWINVDDIPN